MGVLEVGHVTIGAGVEGVDDHFAVHGAGDFDAAVLKIGGDGVNAPIAFADGFGFGEEMGEFAGIEGFLASLAAGKKFEAAGVEGALEFGEELERAGAEDFGMGAGDGSEEFEAVG